MEEKNTHETLPQRMRLILETVSSPSERCYSYLKEGIRTGYYQRGTRIIERDMISLLRVSRTPLREALRKLEKENLVAHSQHKGCTVIGFSGEDITEIYELRMALECFMLEAVVKNATHDELLALREETISRKDDFSKNGDFWSFHIRLLGLSRHKRLSLTLSDMVEYIERFHVLSFQREGRRERAFQEHISILDHLISGDLAAAQQLMRRHLEGSYEAMRDVLAFV